MTETTSNEALTIVDERVSGPETAFLRVYHRRLRRGPSEAGEPAKPFNCDSVHRTMGMDAVAVVLHHLGDDGVVRVGLRGCLRPSVALDRDRNVPEPDRRYAPRLWEIPAGIIEAEDRGLEGVRFRAAEEAREEMGITVAPEALRALGQPFFLSPGVMAELIYLFEAAVDPTSAVAPEGDGSGMEEGAPLQWVPLAEALARCEAGRSDAKTEIALRRMQAKLAR